MRKYDTLEISPALRAAVDALCEHVPTITEAHDRRVALTCLKCGARGEQVVLPRPGPVVWSKNTPSVTLVRLKVYTTCDEESPLDGNIGDSAGVFYDSVRYGRNQAGGALSGLTYQQIESATEEVTDVRALRKNLEKWLEAVEGLDLSAGFDATVEALSAVPRWEELCYCYKGDSYRSAIDLSNVGYGARDLAYYLSYLDAAEFKDAYGSVTHPALSWLNYVEETDGNTEPNFRGMPAPSRQVLEICIAAVADCVRRSLRVARRPDDYLERVWGEIHDLVEILRETLQEGDEIAGTQDLLDNYHVEKRSKQNNTNFYVVLKADEFPGYKEAADEYQAWARGEVSDYRLETCKVYTPSEFGDIEGDARVGDWEATWDDDELNGTWYGCGGLKRYARPLAEKYAEQIWAHFIGFDVHQ
jgi:hypothetical protein